MGLVKESTMSGGGGMGYQTGNGKVPKVTWLFEHEKRAIIEYAKRNREEGYRVESHNISTKNTTLI